MDFFNISLPRIDWPDIPIPTGLPLRLVAFQCLFLALAIAIEAAILRRGLELKPKRSVEYATAINLLSMVVSWVLFLNIQPLLPAQLRLELIAGVLFDQWAGAITSWVIVATLIIFFLSWVVKVIGLAQLQLFLGDRTREDTRPSATLRHRTLSRKDKDFRGLPNQASVLLIANAISSLAVFLVIVLRLIAQSTLRAPLL